MTDTTGRYALQLFNVSGTDIRFGSTEDGTPYAVASDFAKAMGYAKTQNATDILDEGEAGHAVIVSRSANGVEQARTVAVIFEDGMWELIFRSSLPGGKAIKARVKAILREIRETGRYQAAPRPMTSAEMFAETARMFLEQETRLATVEHEQAVTAAKVAAIEGRHDWFTALGYAKLHDHPTDRPYLARIGKKAAAILRGQGDEPHHRQDATFGAVNTYPVSALERAFTEVRP